MGKKRIFIYFILIVIFIVLVLFRQNQVSLERSQPIINTYAIWKEKGKPVVVKPVMPGNVIMFVKITLETADGTSFEGYVSKERQKMLSEGQGVYADSKDNVPSGKITYVSDEIEFDTGMFEVKAVFTKPFAEKKRDVVYVNTGLLRDVICVSDTIIRKDGDMNFVWKIKEGRAVKQQIVIGCRNGYGVIIEKGLNEGDLIVYDGFMQLSQDDLVNIINSKDNQGV